MSDHTIAPNFTISGLSFTQVFAPTAAQPRQDDWSNGDPFKWRIVVGRFDAASGAAPAFKTTCTFTPKGAPSGTTYGIRQIAYHRFMTAYYVGRDSSQGSQTLATTAVNFTWNVDTIGTASAQGFAAPTFPFFSENPKPIANGANGSLTIVDSPGGTARLVRANLVTGKRNFLQSYESATDFITMLTVVMPDGRHIPVRGVYWRFATKAAIDWNNEKPTLTPTGRCYFDSEIEPPMIAGERLRLLSDNALMPQDTILYKVNRGLTNAEILDAQSGVNTNATDDLRFNGGTYEIVHSRKLLL